MFSITRIPKPAIRSAEITLSPPPRQFMSHFFTTSSLRNAETQPAPSTPTFVLPSVPKPKYPFIVQRSKSNNLPVYSVLKSQGTRKITRIRKIEGDVAALKDMLVKDLGLADGQIGVNDRTKHILIKGKREFEIKKYLEGLGL